jgi:Xaa-Pro aminopeptidase
MTDQTPDAVFAALHQAARAATGARLFTVMVLDRDAGLARRAYSSHPADYPASGAKPMRSDRWSAQVIDAGRSFVANTTAEFADVFPDHALINALGCAAALNIPVSDGTRIVGTVNILDAEGHFTPGTVARLEALVADHRPALLAAMARVPMETRPMTHPVAARLARLRARMAATGTGLVALGPGAHMRWLAGFTPHPDERPCLMLIGPDTAGFLMPALNAADARQHTDLPFWEWRDEDGAGATLTRALAATNASPARIGLDEAMRADFALMLIDDLPQAARGLAGETLGALRMLKEPAELAALRMNAAIADRAQTALRAAIRPGMTETELAAAAKAAFAAEGARPEFAIIGAGANGAFPHHHTGDTVLKAGDAIVVDIGGGKDGYYSDITRMAAVGHAPEGYAEVHAVVDAAVAAALAAIRPGVTARSIDAAARKVITDAGYGDFFTHRTGHGLGSEIHEPPYITASSDTVLEEGMVFTVEPGIYLPGRFGIRLEEVAVVTATGVETLSSLGRELHVA